MEALANAVFEELHCPDAGTQTSQFMVRSVPPAQGDRTLIRQVLVNLLSNAIKFTETRNQAFIEFGYLPGTSAGGAYYVKDNGVGFDMQYVGKLFGVFQRLHP